MIRRILAILLVTLFLAACAKKEPEAVIPDGFKGPTSGPDLSKIQPTYGPNDPVPVDDSIDSQ